VAGSEISTKKSAIRNPAGKITAVGAFMAFKPPACADCCSQQVTSSYRPPDAHRKLLALSAYFSINKLLLPIAHLMHTASYLL
jgi:hypothetical protein